MTGDGLDILRASTNAISFLPGRSWRDRTKLLSLDDGHQAIDRELAKSGSVRIDVTANVDGLKTTYHRDGSLSYESKPGAVESAKASLLVALESAREGDIVDLASVRQALRNVMPSDGIIWVNLTASREGVLLLAASDSVRSMRLSRHSDPRGLYVDPTAMSIAALEGTAQVTLVLRTNNLGGNLSPNSILAAGESNQQALIDIVGETRTYHKAQHHTRLGAVSLNLKPGEIDNIVGGGNPHLLAVVANKPVAEPHLTSVASTMNMQSAYNAGFIAGGQKIAILDMGIDALHPFFGGRVTVQECFGTSDSIYETDCLNSSFSTGWDSPHGTANSALPIPGTDHDTHVAGIAAGERTAPSPLRGTAPGAEIWSVKVFSKDRASPSTVIAHYADIEAALQYAAQALPTLGGANQQPVTFNLSLGGGTNSMPCSDVLWTTYATAIHNLSVAGVPVIASTGNNFRRDGIAWPACLPEVIKVSSVLNDQIGDTRSPDAQIVDPAQFPGGIFWFAPGGSVNGSSSVYSSFPAGLYNYKGGTSMAAPQIAGLYAAAKVRFQSGRLMMSALGSCSTPVRR